MKLAPLTLAAIVSVAVAQEARPPSESIGFNRHAQLLEASLDERGRLTGRYMTVGNTVAPGAPREPIGGAFEVRDLADPGQRLARVGVDAALLPLETFTNPPRFRAFPGLRGEDHVAYIGPDESLVFRALDGGRSRLVVSHTTAIHDAVAVGDDALVLSRSSRGLGLTRFSEKGLDARHVSEGALGGAFVREGGRSDGSFVVALQRVDAIVLELWTADGELAATRGLGPDVEPFDRPGPGRPVRCDARREGDSLLVALSHPNDDRMVGRILACDLLAEDGPALLWDGRPWPAVQGDTVASSAFGHAVELLPDVTGDGVPEIATTTPTNHVGIPGVHVLNGRTGEIVTEHIGDFMDRTGADLSLDPTERFLMVTVLPHGYPEDLTKVARVQVFRVPTAEHPTLERVR